MKWGLHPWKDLLEASLGSPVLQEEREGAEQGSGSSSDLALTHLWVPAILQRPSHWPLVPFVPFCS